jgi:hypothetical protein
MLFYCQIKALRKKKDFPPLPSWVNIHGDFLMRRILDHRDSLRVFLSEGKPGTRAAFALSQVGNGQ